MLGAMRKGSFIALIVIGILTVLPFVLVGLSLSGDIMDRDGWALRLMVLIPLYGAGLVGWGAWGLLRKGDPNA